MTDWLAYPHLPVMSTLSPESAGVDAHAVFTRATPASTAWPTTNKAIYVPIALRSNFFVRRLWWLNGATANGNVDCGVYSRGGARLASTGSTAQAGTSVVQSVTLGTAVLLTPGAYYLALTLSSATGTVFATTVGAVGLALAGCAEQVTALPLPDPATLATMVMTILPVFGIADVATI